MNYCSICNNVAVKKEIHSIPMHFCEKCLFFWRVDQDVPISHYQEKVIDFSPEKEQARLRNSRNRVQSIVPYIQKGTICDIGCAEGVMLKAFKDAGLNAVGLEPSDMISEYAIKNQLTIEKGTINDLKLIEKYHPTTYTLFHVIEHLPDPKKSLQDIFSNMKSLDTLVIETPDFSSYSLKKTNYIHDLIYPEHFYYFNEKNLVMLLELIGFEVRKVIRRDFDQYNMGIKESLFRLGVGTFRPKTDRMTKATKVASPVKKNKIRSLLIKPIKIFLALLVGLLRRRDYMLIIAVKE